MAVLIQRLVDASVSGIMFTGSTTVIEASWRIGETVVAGHITPNSWHVSDSGIIECKPGLKTERTDRQRPASKKSCASQTVTLCV